MGGPGREAREGEVNDLALLFIYLEKNVLYTEDKT